jgi:hypothetical protein
MRKSYTANETFGLGQKMGENSFVVFNGDGTSVDVKGLYSGINYWFRIYEYDSISKCY